MSCKEAFTNGSLEKTEQKRANPEQEINPLTSSHVRSFCNLKATEILLLIHIFKSKTPPIFLQYRLFLTPEIIL